jgi:hypothetical protein
VSLADQFQAAADRARTLAQLEDLSRLLWRANVEGHVDDGRAGAIGETLAARRRAFSEGRGFAGGPSIRPPCARRRPPRPPDRARSIERRRRQASSGAMPPALAANFTTGEAAVLAVIARQPGKCALFIDAIAAMAGTCRSVVQSAVREAARLGLLRVTERRIPGRRSLSNLVEIISPEWLAWMSYRVRKNTHHGQDYKITSEIALRSAGEKRNGAPAALAFRGPMLATVGGSGTERAFDREGAKFGPS